MGASGGPEPDPRILIGARSESPGADAAGPAAEWLRLKYMNRHGLIAGATGAGKTVTLQILAEGLSQQGGGYRDLMQRELFWWMEYAVIWTYPLWGAFESFR